MTAEQPGPRYNWIVQFAKDSKLYTYLNRDIPFMVEVLRVSYGKQGRYPFRVWVIVDDEIQKVEIT